jgi:hypothetical protein
MKIKIVGMKYRSLDPIFLKGLSASTISLELEPKNPHDRFAVKCISSGIHFGYIERSNSKFISQLLYADIRLDVKVLGSDSESIAAEIKPSSTSDLVPMQINVVNGPGIYEIGFLSDGDWFIYIGQSNNIKQRIQSHQRDLMNCTHHNIRMQIAWLKSSFSFSVRVLFQCPTNLSPFQQQALLFEKEVFFIESYSNVANSIDGDLVLTADSRNELRSTCASLAAKIKDIRALKMHQKERLGNLILDVGLMDRVVFKSSNVDVNSSNVLTWWNKVPRSPLDYVPRKRVDIFGANELISSLKGLNSQLQLLSSDKKFIDEFISKILDEKVPFETCKISELRIFLNILNKHLSSNGWSAVKGKVSTTSNGKISYCSSLVDLINPDVLSKLQPFNQ